MSDEDHEEVNKTHSSEDKLIEQNTDGEVFDLVRVVFIAKHLWCHIPRSAVLT